MKLSYAIPVKDELLEITKLLNFLIKNKDDEDEIVILFDSENGSKGVEDYLRAKSVNAPKFAWYPYKFDGHFANMKNHLTSLCSGDWIVQLDADEMVGDQFIPWVKGKLLPETENDLKTGILFLKGGDLTEEIKESKKQVHLYPLSDYFKEEFFETKMVVYTRVKK